MGPFKYSVSTKGGESRYIAYFWTHRWRGSLDYEYVNFIYLITLSDVFANFNRLAYGNSTYNENNLYGFPKIFVNAYSILW